MRSLSKAGIPRRTPPARLMAETSCAPVETWKRNLERKKKKTGGHGSVCEANDEPEEEEEERNA